jgi:hypothetical protein
MSEKAKSRRTGFFLDKALQKYVTEERQYQRERRAFHKRLDEQIAVLQRKLKEASE